MKGMGSRPFLQGMWRVLAISCLVGSPLGSSDAQEDAVRLSGLQFGRARLDGMRDDWMEIVVEIEGGRNLAAAQGNQRFVSGVEVALNLAFLSSGGQGRSQHFFRSAVKIAAIEQGEERKLYFYISPEVIRRDRLSRQPDAYLIEIQVEGKRIPVRSAHLSSNLKGAARVESFRNRVGLESRRNDGLLVPIYETPFFYFREKLRDSPAYVR